MTRREAVRQTEQERALMSLGFSSDEAERLRRISMQLHRWHELECGTDNGGVERDETTGKCFWYNANTGKRYPCADRETGARKRLNRIIEARNQRVRLQVWGVITDPSQRVGEMCGDIQPFVQGDPRGAALYIIRPGDVPEGASVESYYTHGVVVY